MDTVARKFFFDHQNPLVKLDSLGSKLFLKASNKEEEEFIEKNQIVMENALRYNRVERRCARAKAEWCPALNLAKVSKVAKGLLENFGYQDKNGIFMYPEEMLILMETNRLEMTFNEVPLTIQECYEIILQNTECNLKKYMVYKKFVLQGYRLISYKEILRRRLKDEAKQSSSVQQMEYVHETKKRPLEQCENIPDRSKNSKLQNNTTCGDEQLNLHIQNIFENMRKEAPKAFISQCGPLNTTPEYCVFLPSNKSRTKWNSSLYICEEGMLNKQLSLEEGPTPIFAICSGDNISLCRLSNVNLPSISC